MSQRNRLPPRTTTSTLKIEKLKLYQATKGFYSIFYNSQLYVDPGIIKGGSALNSMATAELGTTFISRAGELAGTVATVTNQLLRSLGYSIDLKMLRAEVERLLRLANAPYGYEDESPS